MKQKKYMKKKGILALLIVFSLMIGQLGIGVGKKGSVVKEASAATEDLANLRLIFTSDLHGQVTTEDYETGGTFTTGGLSRAATLISEAKSEVNANNTLLFDLGDVLYDYTTDYIYNYDSSANQPIYSAMSKLGYDAIVLGNHDFDYDLNYIQTQLKNSGMSGKVVLSNVVDANTKKHIWTENKIVKKSLVTKSGKTITVNVGLIGETVPALSKKRTSYKGILETEDIVKNVKKEVTLLQNKGADIIVVLAHSGIGEENPEEKDASVGYALTKVPGVDAVLCGHSHVDFPSSEGSKYDSLPGVDLETGLVNGKTLIQVEKRGASVGVADLMLSNANNKISIADRKTSIRKVTEDTEINQTINSAMGSWAKTFLTDCSEILCEVDSKTELQNFFGTQEDTDAIQLLNNIKISYGLTYINNTDTKYKSYPVVAASSYIKYGMEDEMDYVNVRDVFKRSNMYDLINYKTGLYLYTMTGAQIREWLEWTASFYAKPGESLIPEKQEQAEDSSSDEDSGDVENTENSTEENTENTENVENSSSILENSNKQISLDELLDYDMNKPLQYTLKEDYVDDWKNIYIFDGLEYQIDTTIAPRYNEDGEMINDTNRVISLTRNGAAVSDSAKFVVATHRLPDNDLFNKMEPTKLISTSTEKYRNYIENYIEKVALAGTLKTVKDDNWSVDYHENYDYLVKTGELANEFASEKNWIVKSLLNKNGYEYYLTDFSKQFVSDTTGPCINAVAKTDSETNKDVKVLVQANDKSGVSVVKYALGKYGANNSVWDSASKVSSGSFNCTQNGTYSVMAVDGKGNRSVTYLRILNINRSILDAPVVETYTNRKDYIEGTAEAGATIYFKVDGGSRYSAKVGSNGKFKYALPSQNAGKQIFVYVVDSKGRTSSRTIVTVKRTGPNKPVLNAVKTNSKKISGKLNDTYAYPMILVNKKTLYVQNATIKALYKKSAFYDKSYKVKIVPVTIASGKFTVTLPKYLTAGTKVQLKTIDVVSRCSLITSGSVVQKVPNKPVKVSAVTNLSKKVKIYTEEKCTRALVKIGKKSYQSTKSSYSSKTKRYCFTVKIPRTDSTSVLKTYVSNAKGNSKACSIRPTEVVPNKPKVDKVKKGAKKITGKVDIIGALNGKNTVSGTKTKVYVYVNGKRYKAKVKNNGIFTVKVSVLKKGTKIICKAKNRKGTSLSKTLRVK